MKTAAIVYEFPCHSETFVVGQIRGLIDLGCDVRIFADNADTVAVAEKESAQRDLLDRVTYFGLPFKQLRESVGRWQSRRPASAEQVTTHRPARRLRETAEAGLRLRIEGRAFGRNSHFDVIHAHFGPNGVRAIRLRKMDVLRGPTLTSFYGYDVGRHWSRSGYSHLFAEGDRFIALSNHMRTALLELGAPEQKTIVHPLGIHVEQFKPAARKSGTRFEILSVARLIPKKGIEYALRAVAELSRQGIEVHYTVVGGGPLRDRLESLAHQLGIDGRVKFTGPQPQKIIAELMQRADVLVAPSVTAVDGDTEGTPVVILEAEACGIPVVATRHAGIPEIVADGSSGFLVPEASVEDLAKKIAELVENEPMRRAMGEAGRAIVTEKHDIHKLNRVLLGIYESLIS